jgi:hypothetical protein
VLKRAAPTHDRRRFTKELGVAIFLAFQTASHLLVWVDVERSMSTPFEIDTTAFQQRLFQLVGVYAESDKIAIAKIWVRCRRFAKHSS